MYGTEKGMLLACAASLFTVAATAAPNPLFAPKLTLSCVNLVFNGDNSADLTCRLQNTADGNAPVITQVRLQISGGNGAFSQYTAPDISVGGTSTINLHFAPNTYKLFTLYQAFGVADDAIYGDIISQFIGEIGEPLTSNSLQLGDPQQPPQFADLALCSMEALLDVNGLRFPVAGGQANLVVDTQVVARGVTNGCAWYATSSNPYMAYFGTYGNNSTNRLGPSTAAITVGPNVAVNGSTTVRQVIIDAIAQFAFTPIYEGQFTFSQDGVTCVYSATGFSAPQAGVTNAVLNVTATPSICQWSVTGLNGSISLQEGTGTVYSGNGTLHYTISPNFGAVSRNIQILFGNALILTAVQPGYQPNITLNTNPQGLSIVVDNQSYTAPQIFSWATGSQHSIGAPSPQGSNGTQYLFSSWGQGGAQSQTITVSADATYTAFFATQYLLTTAVTPGNSGTVTPSSGSYYNTGTNVALTATPANGYSFASWTGPVASPSSAATTVLMNGPQSVTANFVNPMISVTVNTSVPSLTVTVDGANYPSGQSFQWTPGSPHSISVNSPQSIASGDYAFSTWSDGGMQMHTVAPAASTTYMANFTQLTTLSVVIDSNIRNLTLGLNGLVQVDGVMYSTPQTFQWTPGSSHTVWAPSVQALAGGGQYVFTSWSDGGAVTHTISPIGPTTYTAYYYFLRRPGTPLMSSAAAPIRIQAGDAGYTDSLGKVWAEDQGFSGGRAVRNSDESQRSSTEPFEYGFAMPDGNYLVTLKFAADGQRLFDVAINSNPVLTNFDPAKVSGVPFRTVDERFAVAVSGGRLSIGFHPTLGEATISGIEVLPADASALRAAGAVRLKVGGSGYVDPDGTVWDGDHNYSEKGHRFVVPNGNYVVTLDCNGLSEAIVNGQRVRIDHDSMRPSIPVSVFNGEIVLQFPQQGAAVVDRIEVLPAP